MFSKDVGYAVRTLRRGPVFLATATVTLALGVGATTAIFSVAKALLLRPLPYKNPGRLVLAAGDMRKRNTSDQPLSVENFTDLRNGTTSVFENFAAVATTRNNIPRDDGTPEQVHFAQVTTNFFPLLGAKIALGRNFVEADGQPPPVPSGGATTAQAAPATPAVAILSYEYWMRRYGGNAGVLGHALLNSTPNSPQVVGVLAPGFELLFRPGSNVERTPDIYVAARLRYNNSERNTYFLHAIGRWRAASTLDQAKDAGELAAAEIRRNFPIYGTGDFHFRMEPMHQYLVSEVRPAILTLMGAVVFLLLISCANVANLLLVRASLRERELALRAALGGSRWRLVGQMLTEALMLSAAGTLLGLGLAPAGIRALLAISPPNLPRLESITLDPIVLSFTVLIGLAAAAVFGVAPAWRASRPDLMQVLRGSSRTAGLGGAGPRSAFVIVEVALSFVLLIGSGLMFRSFLALQQINTGLDPRHLLTFQMLGGRGGQVPQQRAARMREILTRLRALSGVDGVTASSPFPLAGGFSPIRWGKEDALADPSRYQSVDWQIVLPGYFEAIRTPLLCRPHLHRFGQRAGPQFRDH